LSNINTVNKYIYIHVLYLYIGDNKALFPTNDIGDMEVDLVSKKVLFV